MSSYPSCAAESQDNYAFDLGSILYIEDVREDIRVQSGGDVMDLASALGLPSTLIVDRVERSTEGLTLSLHATTSTVSCPRCGTAGSHVHSQKKSTNDRNCGRNNLIGNLADSAPACSHLTSWPAIIICCFCLNSCRITKNGRQNKKEKRFLNNLLMSRQEPWQSSHYLHLLHLNTRRQLVQKAAIILTNNKRFFCHVRTNSTSRAIIFTA